jgi:hypothetical protein
MNGISARKKESSDGCLWLTPVILALWGAEIRLIMVQGQSWEKLHEIPISRERGWA